MLVMTDVRRMRSAQALLGACVLAVASAALLAGEVWAQPASGYYLSQEVALNVAPPVERRDPARGSSGRQHLVAQRVRQGRRCRLA